jgi:hypothetical protein
MPLSRVEFENAKFDFTAQAWEMFAKNPNHAFTWDELIDGFRFN